MYCNTKCQNMFYTLYIPYLPEQQNNCKQSGEQTNTARTAMNSDEERDLHELHKQQLKQLRDENMRFIRNAPKGKGKKQARAQAELLESQLVEKQRKELGHSRPVVVQEQSTNGIPKVSRAERRLAAKLAKSASIRAAAEDEAGSMVDHRKLELGAIEAIIETHRLRLVDVPADGNCMFRAIALQCSGDRDHLGLRESAVELMRSQPEVFANGVLENHLGELVLGEQSLNSYCDSMKDTSKALWGGEGELVALSTLLHRPINVFSMDSAVPTRIESLGCAEQECINLSYHKHYYSLGNHYNALLPLEPID